MTDMIKQIEETRARLEKSSSWRDGMTVQEQDIVLKTLTALQKMASGEFRKSYSMDSTSQEWREGYNQAVEDYRAMLLEQEMKG